MCIRDSGFVVFQGLLDGVSFDRIGHAGDDAPALENLIDSHGNRLLGDLIHIGEPSLMDLLVFAGIVEIYDDVCLLSLIHI